MLWPGMQSHEHSGDEADPSRSSRSRPRSLRPRTEQVPGLRDGTKARERENRDGAHEDSRERTARSACCTDMLSGRPKHASRDVPTDHEARGQCSSGCRGARAQLQSYARGALAGSRPKKPKQDRRSTLVSTLKALVRCKMWSGPEHDSEVHGDWSVQQNNAQHVGEHAAHKRTVRQFADEQTRTTRSLSSFDEY